MFTHSFTSTQMNMDNSNLPKESSTKHLLSFVTLLLRTSIVKENQIFAHILGFATAVNEDSLRPIHSQRQ